MSKRPRHTNDCESAPSLLSRTERLDLARSILENTNENSDDDDDEAFATSSTCALAILHATTATIWISNDRKDDIFVALTRVSVARAGERLAEVLRRRLQDSVAAARALERREALAFDALLLRFKLLWTAAGVALRIALRSRTVEDDAESRDSVEDTNTRHRRSRGVVDATAILRDVETLRTIHASIRREHAQLRETSETIESGSSSGASTIGLFDRMEFKIELWRVQALCIAGHFDRMTQSFRDVKERLGIDVDFLEAVADTCVSVERVTATLSRNDASRPLRELSINAQRSLLQHEYAQSRPDMKRVGTHLQRLALNAFDDEDALSWFDQALQTLREYRSEPPSVSCVEKSPSLFFGLAQLQWFAYASYNRGILAANRGALVVAEKLVQSSLKFLDRLPQSVRSIHEDQMNEGYAEILGRIKEKKSSARNFF